MTTRARRAVYTGKRSNFNSYLCISLTVMYCQNIWYEWCATLIWYNKNSKSKGGSSFLVGRKGGKARKARHNIGYCEYPNFLKKIESIHLFVVSRIRPPFSCVHMIQVEFDIFFEVGKNVGSNLKCKIFRRYI